MTDICFENAVKALYEIQVAEAERLSEQAQHTEILFSERFKAKMQKLIRRREKPYYPIVNTSLKRVAVIILAAVIATISATIAIASVYQPFADFITEVFDDHTLFRPSPNNQTSSVDPLAECKEYSPSYIPEGFEMESTYKDWSECQVKYVNAENKFFYIKQLIYDGGTRITIDTEGVVVEDIYVQDNRAIYYAKNGEQFIRFTYNQSFISIYGNIDRDELINIANSLNLEEN